MKIALIPMFLVMAGLISLPLFVGLYVYRDARRRGMNGVLWAVVAAFVPSLIGLLVYLLVRGNYSDLRCPQCGAPVQEHFVVCPQCGTKLRPACPNCSTPVETDWKLCPKCTQPLTDAASGVQPPVRAKDSFGWKILVLVCLVPVLLLLVLVGGSFLAFSSGGSVSCGEMTIDDYYEEMQEMDGEGYTSAADAKKVREWIDGLAIHEEQAYALRYTSTDGEEKEHFFLVYVPAAGAQESTGLGQTSGTFGTTLTMELHRTGNSGYVFNLCASAKKAPKLKVVLDGKKIPCEVTDVDYNPTVFREE